jgi:hypothetical protein
LAGQRRALAAQCGAQCASRSTLESKAVKTIQMTIDELVAPGEFDIWP